MCSVGSGWEGNVAVSGKQPTALSSIPETNSLPWDYGAVLYRLDSHDQELVMVNNTVFRPAAKGRFAT